MALADPEGLVPMGQLASALGVVPGTATTMVKALADSGLARYEPYAGVRLTPAGEKLAALVLRRHRLVELFLVKVMGMSWTEVHDEAENLEHAVSDRLIDRIDEMLGRPAVDPHGDPDPGSGRHRADARVRQPADLPARRARDDLARERSGSRVPPVRRAARARPGDVVRVEERNAAGDSVLLRGRNDRRVTIGARAASKVLVQAAQKPSRSSCCCPAWGSRRRRRPPNRRPSRSRLPTTRFWSRKRSTRRRACFRTSSA